MPKKPIKKFTAWSFSRLDSYETCPLMARCKFIDRIKEPPSPAMDRGSDIHDKAEKYVIGSLKKIPEELKLFEDEFKALRKIRKKVQTEGELAVNRSWEPCDWFAATTWLRAKIDLFYPLTEDTLVAVDYKTGKMRPKHKDQLDLYAPVIFATMPHVDVIQAELWYIDEGEVVPGAYSRKNDFERLKKYWGKRSKKMLSDASFQPTPCYACRWCWFGQGKVKEGGPEICVY